MRAMMEKVLKTIGFENKDGQWLITVNMEEMDETAIFVAVEVDDRLCIINNEEENEYQLDEFINLYGRFIQNKEEKKMKTLNFNQLAWEAPVRNGQAGYLPTDKYYKEIIEWLRTGNERGRVKMTNDVIRVRKEFEGSEYDAIVEYTKSTGSIIWQYRRHNEFHV